MARKLFGLLLVLMPLVVCGCQSSDSVDAALVQTEVAGALAAERTAVALTPSPQAPAPTSYPTYTPPPTWTPAPTWTPGPTEVPTPTATGTPDVEALLASATAPVDYDELLRNTESYIGQVMTWQGEVQQVMEIEDLHVYLRIAVTPGTYVWDDVLWVEYDGPRLLEGDLVTLTGQIVGRRSYESVQGKQITIPEVEPLSLELVGQETSPTNTPASAGPTNTPVPAGPTDTPAPAVPTNTPIPQVVPLKQEFQGQQFAWNLYDVKRRKAVYWYDEATIAQGTYLLVFIEFRNTSSGTAYPANEPNIAVLDSLGNVYYDYDESIAATISARWQFQCGTLATSMNPGEVLGTVVAWDLPGGAGDLYLNIGNERIYLGNFDQMTVEDQ